jgi:hypothetical protein
MSTATWWSRAAAFWCCLLLALAALVAPGRADGEPKVKKQAVPADAFRYLPTDTRAVWVVNVAALGEDGRKRGAELFARLYKTQLAPELKDLDKLPVSDPEWVILAFPYFGDQRGIVLLRGKVDAALLEKQMRAAAAKASPKAVDVRSVGKPPAPVFGRKVDQKELQGLFPALGRPAEPAFLAQALRMALVPNMVHVSALDEQTLIISTSGPLPIERALRRRPIKSEPVVSAELKQLLGTLNPADAASVVLTEDALAPVLRYYGPQELPDWSSRFEGLVARVEGGQRWRVTLSATCKSEEEAKSFEKDTAKLKEAKLAFEALFEKGQRDSFNSLLGSAKTSRKGKVVTVTGELSKDDALKLWPSPLRK